MEPAWVCLTSASNFGGKSRKMGGVGRAAWDWPADLPA